MTPEQPPELPTAGPTVRIEVCEKHGLRYNAEAADGCARCRTEAGERSIGRAGFVPQRAPDAKRGLLVAAALVAAIGGSLFAAHSVAYHAAKTVMEQVIDESLEGEVLDEETLEAAEDAFEEMFVD